MFQYYSLVLDLDANWLSSLQIIYSGIITVITVILLLGKNISLVYTVRDHGE